jgi:hypothetical protein
MARGGRKYPLLLYRHLLGRWWTPIFSMGLVLLLYVGILWGAEWYFIDPAENPFLPLPELSGIVLLAIGILAVGFSLFLFTIRSFAYVQMFGDHFRIVTPFLRLNIAYKRIHRVTSAEMASLFPPKNLSSWQREMIGPLLSRTANVVYLTKSPISRFWLKFFLSPFFFHDKTAHFVFIVDDWMRFSTELDSAQVSRQVKQPAAKSRNLTPGLLDDLNRKMK